MTASWPHVDWLGEWTEPPPDPATWDRIRLSNIDDGALAVMFGVTVRRMRWMRRRWAVNRWRDRQVAAFIHWRSK